MPNKHTTIVFIAGSSRSGSTMLEHQLAHATGGVSCGELYRIGQFYLQDNDRIKRSKKKITCSCGTPVKQCDFWRETANLSGLDYGTQVFCSQLEQSQRAIFKLAALFLGPKITRAIARVWKPFARELEVAKNCFRVYETVSQITGSSVILDSSKQIHQYLILRTLHPESVRLIALVRNGRAVTKSMIRGARKENIANAMSRRGVEHQDNTQILRYAARAWMKSTANAIWPLIAIRRSRRLLLRYEEFCRTPKKHLQHITDHLTLQWLDEQPAQVIHAIGGSPSRNLPNFSEICLDERWRNEWTDIDEKSFGLGPKILNKILGYGN